MKNSAMKKPQAGLVSGNTGQNQGSAWRGTWDRPLSVDEKSLDALTVARMTDHNVRGGGGPEGDQTAATAVPGPENTDATPRATPSLRVVPTSGTEQATAPATAPEDASGPVNGTEYVPTHGDPDDGGKLSPADAERISSAD